MSPNLTLAYVVLHRRRQWLLACPLQLPLASGLPCARYTAATQAHLVQYQPPLGLQFVVLATYRIALLQRRWRRIMNVRKNWFARMREREVTGRRGATADALRGARDVLEASCSHKHVVEEAEESLPEKPAW